MLLSLMPVLFLTFSDLEFLNGCISFSIGSINTKLDNAADFNVLFLTKWVSCCLSYNEVLIPSPSRFETNNPPFSRIDWTSWKVMTSLHFTSLHFITGTVWLASPNKWKEPLVLEGHSVILSLNQHSVRETYKNGDKTVGDKVLRDNFCTSNWRSDCRCRYVWMTKRPECRIGPIFFYN